MATEKQYDFFRYLFEQEEQRRAKLDARAQSYFTIVSLYVGGVVFLWDRAAAVPQLQRVPSWVLMTSTAGILMALAATIAALHVRRYEGIAEPDDVIAEFDNGAITDDKFLEKRIADFAVATARNAAVNTRAAFWLLVASFSLTGSVASFLACFVAANSGLLGE